MLASGLVTVFALLAVTACVPPAVGENSPFYGTAQQALDGHWEGNLVACAPGGGSVTVDHASPTSVEDPIRVEIFNGFGSDPGDLISTGTLPHSGAAVTSPPLPLGGCFHVRATWSSQFNYQVTWCTGLCTTVPTAPIIQRFGTAGEPFSSPALVPFEWTVFDPNPDATLTCRLDFDGDLTWDLTIASCPASGSRNSTAPSGSHLARFEVSDSTHPPVTATASYSVIAGPTEPFNIVIRSTNALDATVQAAFDRAVAKWESAIVRGLPDTYVRLDAGACGSAPFDGVVDDLVVDVALTPTPGYYGLGGPCVYGDDSLPRFGTVQIDPANLTFLETTGLLEKLAEHEIGHVLGFGIAWNYNRTLFEGGGTENPRFVGRRAMAEYSALGGTYEPGGLPGVPTDHLYGGIDNGHWSQWFFGTELMTPAIGLGKALSTVTIASLGDLGYHVDLTAADPYVLPAPGSLLVQTAALSDRTAPPTGS